MSRRCPHRTYFARIFERGGGWLTEYTSHVSNVGQWMEEIPIVVIVRLTGIHASASKTFGNLDVFTTTILGTIRSRISVCAVESSQRFVAEHVRCTTRLISLREDNLKVNEPNQARVKDETARVRTSKVYPNVTGSDDFCLLKKAFR